MGRRKMIGLHVLRHPVRARLDPDVNGSRGALRPGGYFILHRPLHQQTINAQRQCQPHPERSEDLHLQYALEQ